MKRNCGSKFPDVKETNLSDFAFFTAVMKEKEAYENVLSIILDDPKLKLKAVKVENVVLNDDGYRAIRLDAWALDYKDRQINTEMQNDTVHDDVRKRSRFYQSLSDSHSLKAGKKTKYRNLPATIVIFITQEDIFGKGLVQYTFTERCKELPDLELGDGTQKIFLNMSVLEGREDLVSLMQYMKKTSIDNPDNIVKDERIKRLDSIVNEVRQSEEWEAFNMSIYGQGLKNGEKIGVEKGIEKGIEKGTESVVSKFVINCRNNSMPEDGIERQLELMGFDKETARSYMKRYGRKKDTVVQ